MSTFLVITTIALYLGAASLLARRLASGIDATSGQKYLALAIALIAAILHAWGLIKQIYLPAGLDLAFFPMLSLMGCATALMVIATAFGKPLENLAIAALPIAALTLLLQVSVHTQGNLVQVDSGGMMLHILISIVAYSILSIAAVQALLIAVQDRHLRNRHPGGFMRALPALETMECLLIRLIATGFGALTIALLSGAIYIENIFAQHLVHKTTLTLAAWLVFAILLFGHWRFGWRGRTAVRWTLGGTLVLIIGYFGSRFVSELILGRV